MNTITARTGQPTTGVYEDEELVRSVIRQSGDTAKPGGPVRGWTVMVMRAYGWVHVCLSF